MSTMPRPGGRAEPRPAGPTPAVASSAFLSACRGESPARTPIWLMRQAGRYLPEYRALRERHTMQALLAQPEVAAKITLQPLARFDLDAAIVFTDILPPLAAMGLEIAFRGGETGEAPLVVTPLSRPHDIDVLAVPPAVESLGSALQTIAMVKGELDTRGVPLIGFVGAPFTLASYAIEGGGSRNYAKTKALMYSQPAAWGRLMTKLVTMLSDYLVAQARAGASALQVFDSWAGVALGRDDYVRYVQPYNRRLFAEAGAAGVPVINFSTGTAAFIEEVAACGGDVVGVDWRMPLEFSRAKIGEKRPIQGNLDPAALLAPWRELAPRVDSILKAGAGGGHIFNLGHGILPETPLDTVARLIDRVHGGKGRAS
jgi:uroporphyrinogen decarboxylase